MHIILLSYTIYIILLVNFQIYLSLIRIIQLYSMPSILTMRDYLKVWKMSCIILDVFGKDAK